MLVLTARTAIVTGLVALGAASSAATAVKVLTAVSTACAVAATGVALVTAVCGWYCSNSSAKSPATATN